MKVINLLEGLKFGDKDAHAEALHYDTEGRAIRFMLKPGQSIHEHSVPSSPFLVVVLKGTGAFTGGDGVERTSGPNTLLVFDPGEHHTVRALDELVFIGILHGIQPPDQTGSHVGPWPQES